MVLSSQTLDRAAIKKVLDERARILAVPVESGEPEESTLLAVLPLSDEHYAVELSSVREIRRGEPITSLPGTPPFWLGLLNLRGRLLPVLDLARFLALPSGAASKEQALVIVEHDAIEVALVADGMPEVRQLRLAELGPPVRRADGYHNMIQGVTADLLTVLNLAGLLADPRLVVDAL